MDINHALLCGNITGLQVPLQHSSMQTAFEHHEETEVDLCVALARKNRTVAGHWQPAMERHSQLEGALLDQVPNWVKPVPWSSRN